MPIRPENAKRYPKDWPAISKRIRKRARNRCECRGECGLRHLRVGGEQRDVPVEADESMMRVFRCAAVNGKPHPVTGSKVVLTVMHLNHQPEDVRDENLMAGCQKCHLRYDAPMKAAGIKSRKRATLAVGDLFEPQPMEPSTRMSMLRAIDPKRRS